MTRNHSRMARATIVIAAAAMAIAASAMSVDTVPWMKHATEPGHGMEPMTVDIWNEATQEVIGLDGDGAIERAREGIIKNMLSAESARALKTAMASEDRLLDDHQRYAAGACARAMALDTEALARAAHASSTQGGVGAMAKSWPITHSPEGAPGTSTAGATGPFRWDAIPEQNLAAVVRHKVRSMQIEPALHAARLEHWKIGLKTPPIRDR